MLLQPEAAERAVCGAWHPNRFSVHEVLTVPIGVSFRLRNHRYVCRVF